MLRLRHGRLATRAGIVGLFLAIAGCAHPAAPAVRLPAGSRTITFEQLEASLAALPPCTVVFDIDDTTLHTGLAFLFAQG